MSELNHHGVLGMRWGVRRYQPYGEGGYNPKNKTAKKLSARKEAKQMSDADLTKAIDRLKKENEYVRLSSENISDGKNFVKQMALTGATALTATVVSTAASKGGQAVVAKLMKELVSPTVFNAVYKKK